MSAKASKKTRTKNFSGNEVDVMVEEVVKRAGVLFGPLKGPKLTQFHRDRAWGQVVDGVNAVAPVPRSLAEIKNKYKDFKNRTKRKANALKREGMKTGGGQNDAAPLNANEEKVIGFIGTASIEGITGGVDSFRPQVVNNPACSPPESFWEPSCPASPFEMSLENLVLPPPSPFLSPSTFAATAPEPVPEPVPGPSSSSNRKIIKGKRKFTKTAAWEQFEKTANLQNEGNDILREPLLEFKDFKQQFLELKSRELDLKEEELKLKRIKYSRI